MGDSKKWNKHVEGTLKKSEEGREARLKTSGFYATLPARTVKTSSKLSSRARSRKRGK